MNNAAATEKVNKLLEAANLDLDQLLDQARTEEAEELAADYERGEPRAVKKVRSHAAAKGMSMEDLTSKALAECRDTDLIKKYDEFISSAETRRNSMLRENDRHRMVLAALGWNMQQIEDSPPRMVATTPAEGKSAA